MTSFQEGLSAHNRLRNFSVFCYGEGRRCWQTFPIGTDRVDPSHPLRIVTVRDRLSVRDRLQYSMQYIMLCWKMPADHPDRDGLCRPITTLMDGDCLRPLVSSR